MSSQEAGLYNELKQQIAAMQKEIKLFILRSRFAMFDYT